MSDCVCLDQVLVIILRVGVVEKDAFILSTVLLHLICLHVEYL